MVSGLTDNQQAYFMLAAFELPALVTWLGLGGPLDHASLALLGSALVGGVVAFIKEKLGGSPPATVPAKATVP